MAGAAFPSDELTPIQPLISDTALPEAAENMLAASRTMLAAASALSSGAGPGGARDRELTAEAIETGFLRALRRDSLLAGGETQGASAPASLLGLPGGSGIPGTGYGRMGAAVTGSGQRAQLYGTIAGAIGYAVGGPVGALLGGMLGGLLGGSDDGGQAEAQRAWQEQETLRRQWLNTPEGFEIEAYLYNLARGARGGLGTLQWATLWPFMRGSSRSQQTLNPVIVNLLPGSVQISGGGAEAGEQAARAFAGALGRVLQLNSVVVPAAGLGGEI